jgi:hypothetical protein
MYVQTTARFSLTGRDEEFADKTGLDATVVQLLTSDEESSAFTQRVNELNRQVAALLEPAFGEGAEAALLEIHKALFLTYELNFINPLHPATRHQFAPWLIQLRQRIEDRWLSSDISSVVDELPSQEDLERPQTVAEWIEAQAKTRCGSDALVEEFLEHRMTVEELKLFVLADGYLNLRFYDTLVLSAFSYSDFVKEEISHHIWDECGNGDARFAHTNQFALTLQRLGLELPHRPIWANWRPYAGFNLHFMLGMSRRHYFKALGSLAMPELFDPVRDRALNGGLRRLGFSPERDFRFYYLHEKLDVDHGQGWLSNIVQPVVREQPAAGRDLALGAALRMLAFRRYNSYLADLFGLGTH